MSDELKPCPFCGSKSVYYQEESKSVECEICLTIGPVVTEDSPAYESLAAAYTPEEIAVTLWNGRDSEPCPRCPVK